MWAPDTYMFANDYGHKMKAVTCECQRILEVYKNKEKFTWSLTGFVKLLVLDWKGCSVISIYNFKVKALYIWKKVFKNGPKKACGRQPLKDYTWSILEYFVLKSWILISWILFYTKRWWGVLKICQLFTDSIVFKQ